jgi:hypothetical protein
MSKEFPDARGPEDHPKLAIPELSGGAMPAGLAALPSSTEAPRRPAPPAQTDWRAALIAKMPDFDPTWPEETQTKWFDGMQKILAIIEKTS